MNNSMGLSEIFIFIGAIHTPHAIFLVHFQQKIDLHSEKSIFELAMKEILH
jgi:hypothetical protein